MVLYDSPISVLFLMNNDEKVKNTLFFTIYKINIYFFIKFALKITEALATYKIK